MFPLPVFHSTFHSLHCDFGRLLVFSVVLLLSLTFCIFPAQAYGLQNGRNPQQAPPPQIEPSNGAQLFLPLIVSGASSDYDERPSKPSMSVTGAADQTGSPDGDPPPHKKRYTFVTDSGGYLDGYWFRNDLPDGQLKFTIEITSPIVSQSTLDPQGFLTQAAVDDFFSSWCHASRGGIDTASF